MASSSTSESDSLPEVNNTAGVWGHVPQGNFLIIKLSETMSGAFSYHLWKDHINCADTLLVEGNIKYVIEF